MGCAVPECSYSFEPDCVLVRFPENETLRDRWKQAIEFGSGLLAQCTTTSGKDESHDLAICSWHFEDKSFSDYQEPCLFEDRYGNLSEVGSCRICLQFYHRNEMVSKDSKLGRKTVSGLIRRILGLTLEDKDFLVQVCEECLVKLDICIKWIQEAKKVGVQFMELAVAAEKEKITSLESENELVELCEDQDLCVDEFVETIRIDQDSHKYLAFEVDLITDREEPQCDFNEEFVAVASDEIGLLLTGKSPIKLRRRRGRPRKISVHETGLLLTEKSPKKLEPRRGPGRPRKVSVHETGLLLTEKSPKKLEPKREPGPRKFSVPVVVQKQDFKDILARKCYICNTLHSSHNDLVGHLPTHATSQHAEYQCIECGNKKFNKVSSYNHHLSFHDLENRPIKCDLCKLGFTFVQSLKVHQNREHGTDHVLRKPNRRRTGKSYQCDSCGKTFRIWSQLQQHDNFYHKKVFATVCTVCSKPFPTKSALLKHCLVHSGEKPYKCDWCGEAYKNSTCLSNHVLKHQSGRLKGKRKQ